MPAESQDAVISSSSKLVALEPVKPVLPLTAAATAADLMVDVEYASTKALPPVRNTVDPVPSRISALTTLLLSALVAVRPKKFNAKAAPPPAVPLPETDPAKDSMVDVSRARTVTEAASPSVLKDSIFASTVEVMAFVVLEPAADVLAPPAIPAASELIVPDEVACNSTLPDVCTSVFDVWAVTEPPISLTEMATPAAALPPPLTVPASEEILALLSARTTKSRGL